MPLSCQFRATPRPSRLGTTWPGRKNGADLECNNSLYGISDYDERRNSMAHLVKLDDELLKGGVAFSEWCTFVVKDADIAFANGVYLSAIVMGLSAMETYLRSEANAGKSSVYELVETSDLRSGLKDRLRELRKIETSGFMSMIQIMTKCCSKSPKFMKIS